MALRTGPVVIVSMLLLLTAVLSGGIGYIFGWAQQWEKPKPPLVRDLPGEWAKAEVEFDRRVKAEFPVGSDERALIGELRHQGFRPNWTTDGARRSANLDLSTMICAIHAEIEWTADGRGKITSIEGKYPPGGCL